MPATRLWSHLNCSDLASLFVFRNFLRQDVYELQFVLVSHQHPEGVVKLVVNVLLILVECTLTLY
jgi:hypothetical protein